ncbi:MAG: hypothetical protein GXP42_00005, partial [Chloroflexi bacterium]|nr:hypothetical protein [Chloroflexota bacterium]
TPTPTPTLTPTHTPTPTPATGLIRFYAFLDHNGDGVPDSDDPPFEGLQVILRDEQGRVRGATLTNSEGRATFSGLLVGAYSLWVTPPEGLATTRPNPVFVNVQAGALAEAQMGFTPIWQPHFLPLLRAN